VEWLFLNSWFRYGPWHNASSDVPVQYYIFMHMKSNANCPTVCLPARLGRQRGDGNDSRTLGAAKFRHPPSAILRTTAYQYCTKVGQFSSFKKNMYCKYVRTIKSCIATVPGTVSLVPGKQGCLRMCQQVLSCCRFSAGFFSGFLVVSKMEITKL
jgi:hypothetical protein